MLGYIETNVSNTGSVVNAFRRVGVEPKRLSTAGEVEAAGALILPGVGAFGDGIGGLQERGLIESIRRSVRGGTPIIGICLGMQLLAEASLEHGRHAGLGLVRGTVVPLSVDQPGYRIPNIGWNIVTPSKRASLFDAGDHDRCYYFLHSYHLEPEDSDVVAATFAFSGRSIVAAIESERIFGIQFHPEKSHDAGLDLLSRYLDRVRLLGKL